MNRSMLTVALIAGLAGVAAAGSVQAEHRDLRGYQAPAYEYAEVLEVDPIITRVQRPVQRDQCWREPVTYREPVRTADTRRYRAPAVLGAIVGGVIGNQFGNGRGRDAATAAGALLGYHAVRDGQRSHQYAGYREVTRYEERCATQTEYFEDERVTGYDVTYRYNGQIYRTVTDFHPGDRLRVQVDVRPAP
ncbi:glycine zipper 2TM domain-containing protein [Pseudomarimonas arenosa]|uniref:Glycine zipper 2TM domain-containing protein n=1 Tax=Pseudomarimonas arenosa TaxID=2774145 RepID=A0AAW3ZLM8_9GAMM|nr:glycine zipper 2TM domain-containing protein [Pseudomarimonas arenosa]MBD8526074.1 glycine zipper 2TM domain-containing protein [Pseudomarimonas arenosa]